MQKERAFNNTKSVVRWWVCAQKDSLCRLSGNWWVCVQKERAYNNAKSRALWRADTYAMANSAEYFGEGTGAYFFVNLQTGGMTE